jgi:hypothetical protein
MQDTRHDRETRVGAVLPNQHIRYLVPSGERAVLSLWNRQMNQWFAVGKRAKWRVSGESIQRIPQQFELGHAKARSRSACIGPTQE